MARGVNPFTVEEFYKSPMLQRMFDGVPPVAVVKATKAGMLGPALKAGLALLTRGKGL